MFKRRHKRSFLWHAREWVWPRLGWGRLATYYRHRLARMPDTSYRIAAGVACGVAVSFTPFLGLHVGLALLFAFVIRANLVAAAVGTVIGNPWTFPFIWVLMYEIGAAVLGIETAESAGDIIDSDLLLADLWTALKPVLWPMVVGGFLLAIPAWWATYWPLRKLVRGYRQRRIKRLGTATPMRRKDDMPQGKSNAMGETVTVETERRAK